MTAPVVETNGSSDDRRSPDLVPLVESQTDRPPWPVVFGGLLLGLVTALVGAQGAVVVELLKDEVWVASGGVEIRDGNLDPESARVVLESPGLWQAIAAREGISDDDFQKEYEVAVAGGTQIVNVTFADTDQELARRVVDEIMEIYITRFRAPEQELQVDELESRLDSLYRLEESLLASLDRSDDLPRLQQIDLQNELVRTRQQITTMIFRIDTRTNDLLQRRNTDPRIATTAFVLDEPTTPAPLRAAVFGFGAGGLVGLAIIYLLFHRETQTRPVGLDQPATLAQLDEQRSTAGSAVKRLVDIAVSGSLLLLTAPLLLMVALLIRVTSRGPALFKQERIGQNDRTFTLYKFRTMTTDNDDSEHRAFIVRQLESGEDAMTQDGRYKLDDRRITFVGRPLRRLSIDELPQLWNVLRGDMTLVGPRPALPWEAELFETRFRGRTRTKPGCTGLWQVSGRSQVSVNRMLELDIEYVRTRTLAKDLSILVRTPLVMLRGDGTR